MNTPNYHKENKSWLKYQVKTFNFAFKGLFAFFKTESKAIIHTVAAVLAVTAGVILKISILQWGLISLVIGMVFISELINSCMERLVDMVSPEHNVQAGHIKDMAAGAVLMASIIAIITGLLVFVPALIELFKINL